MSEAKMNPEVKARWVAALRSGDYRQANQVLRSGDSFCCLGVLCDVYAAEHGVKGWSQSRFDRDGDGYPNDVVCDWAGFGISGDDDAGALRCSADYDPKVEIVGKRKHVSEHNDDGRTFAEIADAIEEQL